MVEYNSGLLRTYLPTFNLNLNVPSVQEIDSKSEIGQLFANHITRNHKGLNWKIFRYTLNPTNYKSFLYAFAITAKDLNPSCSAVWQFVSCTRRMQKAIIRNGIVLTRTECELIKNCIYFQLDKENKIQRDIKYTRIIEELKKQYLG